MAVKMVKDYLASFALNNVHKGKGVSLWQMSTAILRIKVKLDGKGGFDLATVHLTESLFGSVSIAECQNIQQYDAINCNSPVNNTTFMALIMFNFSCDCQ